METTCFINRLTEIDFLIRHKATGNARELSERIGISERSVFNYIKFMRNMGAPIIFHNGLNSYVYRNVGEFVVKFQEAS